MMCWKGYLRPLLWHEVHPTTGVLRLLQCFDLLGKDLYILWARGSLPCRTVGILVTRSGPNSGA